MGKSAMDHMQKLVKQHKQKIKELEGKLKEEKAKGKSWEYLTSDENTLKINFHKGNMFTKKVQSLIVQLLKTLENAYDIFAWFLYIKKELNDTEMTIAVTKEIWEANVQFVLSSRKQWGQTIIVQMRIGYFPTFEEKCRWMMTKFGAIYEKLKVILQIVSIQFFDGARLVEKTQLQASFKGMIEAQLLTNDLKAIQDQCLL